MSDDLRAAAIASLKKKAAFRTTALIFVIIWAGLIVIWFLTGQGYFWPIWPILGMGIALIFVGLDAYRSPRNSQPSQAQIDQEMKRLGGES